MNALRVEGKKIITQRGKEILLRGVNLGGWLMMEGYLLHGRNIPEQEFRERLRKTCGNEIEKEFTKRFRHSFITKDDIANVKKMGLNCVRVPFHYKLIEEYAYCYSKNGFRYIAGQALPLF